MNLSILIPAYEAGPTLPDTLASIYSSPVPAEWRLEVIVVDDGSPDAAGIDSAVSAHPEARLLRLPENQGKYKAMNFGIPQTTGDAVIILDADDTLVRDWPQVMVRIAENWPIECPICFSACRTPDGRTTVSDSDYSGPLTFEDMLSDRHSGEYLPMFQGDALRSAGGYRDPGDLWGCEVLTYLSYAKRSPLWISSDVLRIYHAGRPGSLSASVTTSRGAANLSRCYDHLFDAFGGDYQRLAPRAYRRRCLRQAVFAAIAGEDRALALWRRAAHWRMPLETAAALLLVLSRGRLGLGLVRLGKRFGLLRRYG